MPRDPNGGPLAFPPFTDGMPPFIFFNLFASQFPYRFEVHHKALSVLNKRIVQVIIHLAAWVCFLLLPFVFFPRPKDFSFFSERYLSAFFISNTLLLIAFYYINTYLIITNLLDHKKLVSSILIILAFLIFYGCFPRLYHYFFGSLQSQPPGMPPPDPGKPPNFQQPLLYPGNIPVFLLKSLFIPAIKPLTK